MSAPERIFCHPTERQPVPSNEKSNAKWLRGKWKDHDSGASGDVEYIRADLVGPAAIREAALREARQRVNDLVAERQADLHGARSDFNRGAVDALQEACAAILALINKEKE